MEDASGSAADWHRDLRFAIFGCERLDTYDLVIALRLAESWPLMDPTIAELAKDGRMSERSVRRGLRNLESYGVLLIKTRVGLPSVYAFPLRQIAPGVSIPDLRVWGSDRTNGSLMEALQSPTQRAELPLMEALQSPTPVLQSPTPVLQSPTQRAGFVSDLFLGILPPQKGGEREGARGPRGPEDTGTPPPSELASQKSTESRTYESFKGWELPDSVRAECLARGLTPQNLEIEWGKLRNLPFKHGPVLSLENEVLAQLPLWLIYQAKRTKASPSAATAPPIDFPPDLVRRVAGWTPRPLERVYAVENGLDILEQFGVFIKTGEPHRLGCGPNVLHDGALQKTHAAFARHLQKAAAAKRARITNNNTNNNGVSNAHASAV